MHASSPPATRSSAWSRWVLVLALSLPLDRAGAAAPPSPFRPPTYQPLSANARDVAIGDLDGDGALDATVTIPYTAANGIAPTVRVLPGLRSAGRPIGVFGSAIPFGVVDPNLGSPIVAGPFVGADRTDVLFVTSDPFLFNHQFLNVAAGAPASFLSHGPPIQTQVRSVVTSGPVTAIATADFDRDGVLDLMVGYGHSGGALVPMLGESSLGAPTGRFVVRPGLFTEAAVTRIVAADLDGDGDQDVALSVVSLDRIDLHRGSGAGSFAWAGSLPALDPRGLAAADLDQDGILDLVVANSRDRSVSVYRGTGGMSYAPPVEWSTGAGPLPAGPSTIVVADWNGDGIPDLAAANEQDGTVGVLFGLGGGAFEPPFVIPVGARPVRLAAPDLDDDGATDLVVLCEGAARLEVHLNAYGNRDPDCRAALAVTPYGWPPNGALLPVQVVGVTDPDGDPVTIAITAVTQDEPPQEGQCPDAVISGGVAAIRHERMGRGDGRVYAIHFVATDGRGGSCAGVVSVCVPHDRGGESCLDGGQAYVSTEGCAGPGRLGDPEAFVRVTAIEPSEVRFALALSAGARGTLSIFDVSGRRWARLEAGASAAWDRRGAPPGLYFAELRAGDAHRAVRFVLDR